MSLVAESESRSDGTENRGLGKKAAGQRLSDVDHVQVGGGGSQKWKKRGNRREGQ